MRIFPNVIRRTTTLISGVATAIFNESPKRSDRIPGVSVRVSEGRTLLDSVVVKILRFVEATTRTDAYRIPTLSAVASETIRRAEVLRVAPLQLFETRRRADAATAIVIFQTPGTYTWTAPLTGTVKIECWGAGGGGGGGTVVHGAGGGGGGGYSRMNAYPVTAGTAYSIVVGQGGGQAAAGTDSVFWAGAVGSTIACQGKGGSPGNPGSASAQGLGGQGGQASATGAWDVKFSGGNGGGNGGIGTVNGAGGGSSASPTSNGINGQQNGTGGAGNPPEHGAGGTGATTLAGATPGGQPGGGGGGTSAAQSGTPNGGNGAVRLTYTI